MKTEEFYVCSCFFTHNYFLKEYRCHVTYHGDDQRFDQEWRDVLQQKGCTSKIQFDEVLLKVKAELKRRQDLGRDSLKRREEVLEHYTPLHEQLYSLQDSFLSSAFRELVKYASSEGTTADCLRERMNSAADGVYSFSVFTEDFCHELIEELQHYEGSVLPKGRPNTMNNYGILLNELGFDEGLLTPLREKYLQPLAKLMFPEEVGVSLDSHKAFVVSYKMGGDVDLDYHYDNSEVTLNVSLGKDFTDGELYFGDMRTEPRRDQYSRCSHKPTIGLLHRGQHMHGAMEITEGERYNLIIWMRSSTVRNQLCPMCDRRPELVRTVGCGDGYTRVEEETVNVCATL